MEPYKYPFDHTDLAAVKEYSEKLQLLRSVVLRNPLIPGWHFQLKLPSHPLTPNARPTPWFAGDEYNVNLTRILQPGSEFHPQVWLASVQPLDNMNAEAVPVVMKILQPSLMSIPNVEDDDPFWNDEYDNPQMLAEHEAAIYSKLREVQGKWVPYFYGLHIVGLGTEPLSATYSSI